MLLTEFEDSLSEEAAAVHLSKYLISNFSPEVSKIILYTLSIFLNVYIKFIITNPLSILYRIVEVGMFGAMCPASQLSINANAFL